MRSASWGHKMTFHVTGTRVEAVASLLRDGRRRAAAHHATRMLDGLSPDELADVARLLAGELDKAGDVHQGRGRPRVADAITPDELKLVILRTRASLAAGALQDALTARRLVAGRPVDAEALAIFAVRSAGQGMAGSAKMRIGDRVAEMVGEINADHAGAASALLPHARTFLRDNGLAQLKLQGFTAHARNRLAVQWGVTVDQIKRAQ